MLGNLSINTNKFTVNATTGDVYIDKSLSINSSIYITNTMLVNGIVTFTNTLYTSNIYINGNILSASNTNATFANITTTAIIGKYISIDDNNVNTNVTDQIFSIDYTTPSSTSHTGALVVAGGVGINGDLNIGGNVISAYSADISCNMITLSTITCFNDAQISGNLSGANIKCNSIISSTISTGNINDYVAFNVDNSANITTTGTLTVNGISTFNNDVLITGNLTVTGITVLDNYYTFQSFTTTGSLTAAEIFIDNYNVIVDSTAKNMFITYSTPSTDSNSGALIVTGGVGIGGDLNVDGNINAAGLISSNSIITNSYSISSSLNNITDNNSNIFFVINNNTINDNVSNININSLSVGSYFKFLINYNIKGEITISLNKSLFGMIINNGVYTSVSGNSTQLSLNNTNIGDYIDFYSIENYFYIKAESSNNNGFIII